MFSSCQTDEEYVEWNEHITPVCPAFVYMADNTARYAVEYAGIQLADSLPYWSPRTSRLTFTADRSYLRPSQLNSRLRVYRLEEEGRVLELEEELSVSPIVVPRSDTYTTIGLIQLSAGVQVLEMNSSGADSTVTSLLFFYADDRQAPGADSIRITVLAVDQYTLLIKGNRLDNVPDTMKTVTEEFTLAPGKLSDDIQLNADYYSGINRGLPARFFYRISDASNGTVIQDYKVGSSASSTAEIKLSAVKRDNIPYPVYKSSLMQWKYQSEEIPFASPEVLINGDKWVE
jgi:hypothetical protein